MVKARGRRHEKAAINNIPKTAQWLDDNTEDFHWEENLPESVNGGNIDIPERFGWSHPAEACSNLYQSNAANSKIGITMQQPTKRCSLGLMELSVKEAQVILEQVSVLQEGLKKPIMTRALFGISNQHISEEDDPPKVGGFGHKLTSLEQLEELTINPSIGFKEQ